MLNFFRQIIQARPRPFIRLQKFLGIQEEWSILKSHLKPHKYKLLTLATLCSYPLYKPYIDYYRTTLNIKLQAQLQSNQPVPQALESFAKHLVENVLRDPQMRREGAVFIENLSKKDVVLDAIVTLLVESAKDPHFVKETLVLGKYLAHEALQDKGLEQDTVALVIKLMRDPEVKNEIQELVKWLIQQEGTKKELVDLCRDSFQQPKFQNAIKEMMAYAFYEVLMDKETVEKLKLFSFYLIENDLDKSAKEKGNVRGLIDLVVSKVAKGYKEENKESEFKRVLKGEGNEDVFESIDERRKSTQSEEKEQKKFFFF